MYEHLQSECHARGRLAGEKSGGERPEGKSRREGVPRARLAGGDLDRAAGAVLAVKRALRAAQHFDLLHVEEVEQRAVDARVVDVVHVHAHARVEGLQRVRLADAEGRLRLSFEIIYGHAFKPAPRVRVSPSSSVSLSDMRAMLRNGPVNE